MHHALRKVIEPLLQHKKCADERLFGMMNSHRPNSRGEVGMGANKNAARFPADVELFFARSTSHPWEEFSPEGRTLLSGLGVKLEPFVVPTPPGYRNHSVVGFELLAFGPSGESHFALCEQARKAKVDSGVLGVALMLVGTLTARKLIDAWFAAGLGVDGNKVVFTLNVDRAMLACPALKELLNRVQKPGYRLWLEVSEDLRLEDVAEIQALRALIDEFDWLRLALDDSNLLSTDVGALIKSRVELVKVDGKHVQQLHRDDWTTTRGRMAEELAKLGKPGVPLVTEGIENWNMKIALCNRWNTAEYGVLWLQGWHLRVTDDWARLLDPINPNEPEQPKGYLFSGNARQETKSTDPAFEHGYRQWVDLPGNYWKKISPFTLSLLSGLLVALIIFFFTRPDSTAEIEKLIAEEARYSRQAPNGADEYAALFTIENAEVDDVRASLHFYGRLQIASRFRELPRFEKLSHDLDEPPKISGNSATAKTTSTIVFGGTHYTGREEWWFEKTESGWKIRVLRYNVR